MTEATALQKNAAERAALMPQIAAYDQELTKYSDELAAIRQKAAAKGKDIPYPTDVIAKRDAAFHGRAKLVKRDQDLRIESMTLGRQAQRYQIDLDAIEGALEVFVAFGLDRIEHLKQELSALDNAMIRASEYVGTPQNSVRGVMFFLEKPTELLRRAASLRARP